MLAWTGSITAPCRPDRTQRHRLCLSRQTLPDSAVHALRNAEFIEGDIGLFSGRQETGFEFAMKPATWPIACSRQIGRNPLAVSIGPESGNCLNGKGASDSDSYDEVRLTLGLTAWCGDGDVVVAKRRGILGQPAFGRIIGAGSNLD
jgi:hypothetical protein